MGNKIDKMDENLMKYAPLDEEIISNLYFIHDAFRYMDLISLACESIIRPTNESRGRISSLQDFGMILKSCGKQIGRQGTFAKILIAVGELEILLGKMENMWTYDIDQLLVQPINKCISIDSDEITLKRNQIMNIRAKLMESKVNNLPDVQEIEKEYRTFQNELKERLLGEKKIITEFRKNLTKVLEKQLEMNQNSTIHLEALVDLLKKNPKKIKISKDSSSDSIDSKITLNAIPSTLSAQTSLQTSNETSLVIDLPVFRKTTPRNYNIFIKYISQKLASIQSMKNSVSKATQ